MLSRADIQPAFLNLVFLNACYPLYPHNRHIVKYIFRTLRLLIIIIESNIIMQRNRDQEVPSVWNAQPGVSSRRRAMSSFCEVERELGVRKGAPKTAHSSSANSLACRQKRSNLVKNFGPVVNFVQNGKKTVFFSWAYLQQSLFRLSLGYLWKKLQKTGNPWLKEKKVGLANASSLHCKTAVECKYLNNCLEHFFTLWSANFSCQHLLYDAAGSSGEFFCVWVLYRVFTFIVYIYIYIFFGHGTEMVKNQHVKVNISRSARCMPFCI